MVEQRAVLEQFCHDTYPALVGALSLTVHDRFLAEELAQEALLRACQRWSYVQDLQSPAGWCYRVAVNLGRNVLRRRGAERRANARLHAAAPNVLAPDPVDRVAVQRALAGLTRKQRNAVVLRFYVGLSAEETGATLGLSAVAVRGLTYRALGVLEGLLRDEAEPVEVRDDA